MKPAPPVTRMCPGNGAPLVPESDSWTSSSWRAEAYPPVPPDPPLRYRTAAKISATKPTRSTGIRPEEETMEETSRSIDTYDTLGESEACVAGAQRRRRLWMSGPTIMKRHLTVTATRGQKIKFSAPRVATTRLSLPSHLINTSKSHRPPRPRRPARSLRTAVRTHPRVA